MGGLSKMSKTGSGEEGYLSVMGMSNQCPKGIG